MNLKSLVLKALLTLAALHVLTHLLIWSRIPDIPRLSQGANKDRMLQMLEQLHQRDSDIEDDKYPPGVVNNGNQRIKENYKQRERQRMQKPKTFQILGNLRIPTKPTAHTISPYLKHPLFVGKERLLTMLHEAHYFNDSAAEYFRDEAKVEGLASKLPSWETITDRLGGPNPALEGLDTCSKFQSMVPPEDRFIGVAGLFATGTNLLASLLVANCRNVARMEKFTGTGVRWQVNWGKHSPARFRLENQIDPTLRNENFLPVVTVRSPYSWMQSLCRQRYSTHWFHNAHEHCPNLIPNEIDHKWYNFTLQHGKMGMKRLFRDPWFRDNLLDFANFTLDSKVVPVRVRYKSGTLYHDSLAHLWNEWYHEYVDADFPRIIVRLEDLVFHTKEVVTKICSCIGGTIVDDFLYVTETAKIGEDTMHGKDRTNMIKWFTKWHLEDRTRNMTKDDIAYVREHLDPDLLKMFQYEHPAPTEDA